MVGSMVIGMRYKRRAEKLRKLLFALVGCEGAD